MALIEINKDPSRRELLFFGAVFPLFFGVIGAVVLYATDSWAVSQVLWGVASGVTVLFFAIKPLRLPIYLGWIYLAFPIGWAVSHALMVVTYYLVLTPLALALRLTGRDALKRRYDTSASSYFVAHPPAKVSRYFKQF